MIDSVSKSGTVEYFLSKAIEGEEGVTRVTDRTIAYTPILETQWVLAITQNKTELYAPLYAKLLLIGAISPSIYLLMLVGFWFVLEPLAGKLLMRACELERKIQEKTLSLEVESRSASRRRSRRMKAFGSCRKPC
ncbi:MAG: hypothetical protein ACLFTB_02450 [Desulfovibrionales bacterium]